MPLESYVTRRLETKQAHDGKCGDRGRFELEMRSKRSAVQAERGMGGRGTG